MLKAVNDGRIEIVITLYFLFYLFFFHFKSQLSNKNSKGDVQDFFFSCSHLIELFKLKKNGYKTS